jgi:hypothetical protein
MALKEIILHAKKKGAKFIKKHKLENVVVTALNKTVFDALALHQERENTERHSLYVFGGHAICTQDAARHKRVTCF